MIIALIVLLLLVLKFLLNFVRLKKAKLYYKMFLSNKENVAKYRASIDDLFNKAGTNSIVIYDHRAGGIIQRTTRPIAFVIGNIGYRDAINDAFISTISIYRLRMSQSINPFYWLFLPIEVAQSHDLQIPFILKSIINITYWVVSSLAAYSLQLFLDTCFHDTFQLWINKFFQ